MQQLHKNREELFRELSEKISQTVISNVDSYIFLMYKFLIKIEKHKLAVIDKLLVVNFSDKFVA